ncbi:hypothetical protein CEXT_262491 [Caerostris extrusa]|uniref:Uncharacterized protein n=1 Tax=Caerostris extrusa TaxID=172846 RepID=A0AAV4R4K0_CAEEX|nr:hypothetical protein CEXT_262491 [Caerostris extrusa]
MERQSIVYFVDLDALAEPLSCSNFNFGPLTSNLESNEKQGTPTLLGTFEGDPPPSPCRKQGQSGPPHPSPLVHSRPFAGEASKLRLPRILEIAKKILLGEENMRTNSPPRKREEFVVVANGN